MELWIPPKIPMHKEWHLGMGFFCYQYKFGSSCKLLPKGVHSRGLKRARYILSHPIKLQNNKWDSILGFWGGSDERPFQIPKSHQIRGRSTVLTASQDFISWFEPWQVWDPDCHPIAINGPDSISILCPEKCGLNCDHSIFTISATLFQSQFNRLPTGGLMVGA